MTDGAARLFRRAMCAPCAARRLVFPGCRQGRGGGCPDSTRPGEARALSACAAPRPGVGVFILLVPLGSRGRPCWSGPGRFLLAVAGVAFDARWWSGGHRGTAALSPVWGAPAVGVGDQPRGREGEKCCVEDREKRGDVDVSVISNRNVSVISNVISNRETLTHHYWRRGSSLPVTAP